MVIKSPIFSAHIAGPYSVFCDDRSGFMAARRADVSSASGEVSEFLGSDPNPRFRHALDSPAMFNSVNESDLALGEMAEFKLIESIKFSYDSDVVDEPLYTVASLFSSLISIWCGWRVFYKDVSDSNASLDMGFDRDGIDYDRLSGYSIRLLLVGSRSERLMNSEGFKLW